MLPFDRSVPGVHSVMANALPIKLLLGSPSGYAFVASCP